MKFDLNHLTEAICAVKTESDSQQLFCLIAIAERLEALVEVEKLPPQDRLLEFTSGDGELFSIRESMIYEIKSGRYGGRTILETHLGQRVVRGDYTEIRNQIRGDR